MKVRASIRSVVAEIGYAVPLAVDYTQENAIAKALKVAGLKLERDPRFPDSPCCPEDIPVFGRSVIRRNVHKIYFHEEDNDKETVKIDRDELYKAMANRNLEIYRHDCPWNGRLMLADPLTMFTWAASPNQKWEFAVHTNYIKNGCRYNLCINKYNELTIMRQPRLGKKDSGWNEDARFLVVPKH